MSSFKTPGSSSSYIINTLFQVGSISTNRHLCAKITQYTLYSRNHYIFRVVVVCADV